MKVMASVPHWMIFTCVTITLVCLTTTYAASLHQKAQLVDSKEDLTESFQLKSKSYRKVPKRQTLIKAPILLENDDEFQLTVEDYDDRRMNVKKHVKKQRVRRAATSREDGSGDSEEVFTTAKPEEEGSGAVFAEDLTRAAEEMTTEVAPKLAKPRGGAKSRPKLEPDSSEAPEIEVTTAEGNGTDTGSMTSDPMAKSSMRMAIIIAAIVGFWILLAPVICIVCRYRDRKNDKLNKKNKDVSNHNILTPKSEPVTNGEVPEKYTKIDPDAKQPGNDVWESRQLNGKDPHHSQATRV